MSTRSSRRMVGLISGAIAALGLAAASQAAVLQLITPTAAGGCYGSAYCPLNLGFDAQPTWDGATLSGGGEAVAGQGDSQYYAGRYAFIDFGANYADISIYQTWTKYRKYSAGDVSTWAGGFWTSTSPGVWPSQIATPIGSVGFSFESQTALADTQGSEPWVLESDLSAAPVTPVARYLVLQVKTPSSEPNRGEEYAILGTVGAVPEPTSLGLLALGGLALARRRR